MLRRRNIVLLGLAVAAFAVLWIGRQGAKDTPRTRVASLVDQLRQGDRDHVQGVVGKLSQLSPVELHDLAHAVGDDNPNVQRGAAVALASAPSLEIDTVKLLKPGL